jgi:transmembrane sensor
VNSMNSKADRVRELVGQEAADWFVENREGLTAARRATFAAWLKTSPLHMSEYLNVALIAGDLRDACIDPALSFEDLLKRARAFDEGKTVPIRQRRQTVSSPWRRPPWLSAAVAVAAVSVLVLGFVFWKNSGLTGQEGSPTYYIRTGHGEQLIRRLADDSVLRLNTDTSVWVRYDRKQRVVRVVQGQVEFKVAHETARKFIVNAGTVGVIAVGTEFEVYARQDSTLVTVLEGRVAVEDHLQPVADPRGTANARPNLSRPLHTSVEVGAGQQIRVDHGSWPPTVSAVDAQRATAWLRHQIVCQNQPLEQIAAEFNRYNQTPIEIGSANLRSLQVTGVFGANDTESFVAFLRSLDGVQVEVTPTRIRVSSK